MKEHKIVAIDVGYGHTKFSVVADRNGVVCNSFPSLTPVAAPQQFAASMGQKRDTVLVTIGKTTYEVGPQVTQALSGSAFARELDPGFPESDAYRALVSGALYYMDVDKVGLLVLGLPLTTYERLRETLGPKFKGNYQVGNRSIDVGEVLIVPQPQGGYADFLASHKGINPRHTILVVDPGTYTFDWMTMIGGVPSDHRSGALNGAGAEAILRRIADGVQSVTGEPVEAWARLDEAWRLSEPFRISGVDVELGQFRTQALEVAKDAVKNMVAKLGHLQDIDRIIVVGGAAELFHDALRTKFRDTVPIEVAPQSVFANCRGFVYIGESWLKAKNG